MVLKIDPAAEILGQVHDMVSSRGLEHDPSLRPFGAPDVAAFACHGAQHRRASCRQHVRVEALGPVFLFCPDVQVPELQHVDGTVGQIFLLCPVVHVLELDSVASIVVVSVHVLVSVKVFFLLQLLLLLLV